MKDLNFENENISNSNNHNEDVRTMSASMTASLFEATQETEDGVTSAPMTAITPSNQETEIAAMLATTPTKPTKNTTQTVTKPTKAENSDRTDAAAVFALPLSPKATTTSSGGSRSSSLKKKRRNKDVQSNVREEARNHVATADMPLSIGDMMKTSHSMTSLPPDEEQQERHDVIKAKLSLERPYNSLKKCAHTSVAGKNNKLHRYSWGSHSSSTSLHSSATLGLGTSGKDDLWAAIQTNYNYIMDTNLLDTCKEARYEIEGAATVLEKSTDSSLKLLDETQRSDGLYEDPKELRRWLRDMESKLESVPTISELTMLSTLELQRHHIQHSVLYDEIVSHARVVSTCIRAASEREQQQQLQLLQHKPQQQQQHPRQQQQPASLTSEYSSFSTEQNTLSFSSNDEAITKTRNSSSSSSSGINSAEGLQPKSASVPTPFTHHHLSNIGAGTEAAIVSAQNNNKKGEGNLERLRTRYYLLYLKAFEVQLCLDNLLSKRTSTANGLDDATDDEEEEDIDSYECDGAATEDDLNEVVSDLDLENEFATQNSSSVADLQRCSVEQQVDSIAPKPDCDDGDDEHEDEEEEGADVVDTVISKHSWRNSCYNSVLLSHSGDKKLGNTSRECTTATLTDFEADSESSDFEFVQQLRRQRKVAHEYRYALQQQQQAQKVAANACVRNFTTTKISSAFLTSHIETRTHVPKLISTQQNEEIHAHLYTNNIAVSNNFVALNQASSVETASAAQLQTKRVFEQQQHNTNSSNNNNSHLRSYTATIQPAQPMLQTRIQNKNNSKMLSTQNQVPTKQKNIAVISPNTHTSHNHSHSNKSSPVLRKRQQQQQQRFSDISKFNRSNRKSKNCAIFYFKHLDTDNETNFGGNDSTSNVGDSNDGNDADDNDVVVSHSSNVSSGGVEDEHRCGNGALSSSGASHASDILKSAETSSEDDDEGWLYTANTTGNSDCLNATVVAVDSLQSATVSSTTSTTTATGSSSATSSATFVATSAPKSSASQLYDDSDKENKEALAAATATIISTVTIETSSPVIIKSNNSSNNNDSNNCESSHNSTLNGLQAETSASTTAQIQHKEEMDLEINGNSTTNNVRNKNKTKSISNNSYIHLNNNNDDICNYGNNNNDSNQHQQQSCVYMTQNDVVDKKNYTQTTCARVDVCNINVKSGNMQHQQQQQQQHMLLLSPGKRLPPRSPAKSVKSTTSSNTTMSPSKGIVSHESIKQLVLEAEHLVRDNQDATLKTPTKQKHSIMKVSSTVKKREGYVPHPIKKRVQEWLEHQPSASQQTSKSQETVNCEVVGGNRADDCEASGEASETDSVPRQGSDTSEGFTDSIATCMQTSTNSYGNSTELIGGSAEPISGATVTTPLGGGSSSNQSLNVSKIIKRPQTRRKSDRPWSVSCLSQLTTDTVQLNTTVTSSADVQAGLAAHSISESALDSLSPGRPRATSSSTTATTTLHARKYDSKGSLRRRRTRKKRLSLASAGKKSDSGSEEHTDLPIFALMKSCEAMTPTQIQDITSALLNLQNQQQGMVGEQAPQSPTKDLQTGAQMSQLPLTESGEEESQLMKPNFRVGSYTTAYMANEAARLGSLAALASYMHDDEQQGEISNEEHHSSFSETAWDNYQEKYNSENYSEGFDSDAARRLMEFGDDYRNFIDSQSDCCSSLSAANNLDSFSPPRMDSLQKHELKVLNINQDTITSSVDHARRRRTLELEYERRRKTLEVRRKSCQEGTVEVTQQLPNAVQQQQRSPTGTLSSSISVITPKNTMDRHHQAHKVDSATRKLEFGSVGHISHSAQSLPRRTSESDTSTRRRRNGANADDRRRSSRNLEKCIKMLPVANNNSSSSCDDTDDEKEMRNLLQQSRNRLEDTRALKIRCHLLRPEDYHEIINTCRDNIRCLEAVLRGPPGSVLSAQCAAQTKDLLAIWEDLLGWSENAAAARKMQEEMIVLKHSLNRLSNKSTPELLDTEPAIQIAIEALKNEKLQLQSYRTSMLRLNATVHSWLTRQERRLQAALVEQQIKEAAERIASEEAESEQNTTSKIQKHNPAQSQTTQITAITVTDSNGNQVEAHSLSNVNTVASDTTMQAKEAGTVTMKSASTSAGAENIWDIQTLMKAEQEFHKHLKDEVSDMYSAWDEADARINTQLEGLTNSLIAWRQLECGLSEFHQALGQDRGTLKGLEGALVKGQATPVELAQNVKLVAKLLSEKVNVSQEQLIAVHEHLDPNHIYHIAKFTASNGSLSDSGISDGGATSDGGLSERERRLGVLRRLAKQLESALAPGSEAMKSIAARMESAEAELKTLQITCRDLIVRTAATHHSKKLLQQQDDQTVKMAVEIDHNGDITLKPAQGNGCLVAQNQHATNTQSKRKNKNKQRKTFANETTNDGSDGSSTLRKSNTTTLKPGAVATNGDGGSDPDDDPPLEFDLENSSDTDSGNDSDEKRRRRGWAWRIAKVAVPMQLALFTVFCAACFMQPNCCDNLNNLSMSFTPQLRYIRGPPPI